MPDFLNHAWGDTEITLDIKISLLKTDICVGDIWDDIKKKMIAKVREWLYVLLLLL